VIDIKQTLATALQDEPPMTLDKAGIVKAGKRKAVGRHVSIGVAVVAVVGALAAVPIALTSTGGDLEVASSSGPPLADMTPQWQEPPPATGPPSNPRVPPLPAPKPMSAERAAEMTAALAASGVIPANAQVSPVSGEPSGLREIRYLGGPVHGIYKMYNRVITSKGTGGLMIWLDTDQNNPRTCADNPSANHCEVREVNGRHLVLEEFNTTADNRVFLRTVYTWLPDGSVAVVQSSDSVPGYDDDAPGPLPFDMEELVNIATQPWLTF
jgi:hypothetical protein